MTTQSCLISCSLLIEVDKIFDCRFGAMRAVPVFHHFLYNSNCQVKQTPFWKANFLSDRYAQETPFSHLRNAKFHHRIHNTPILAIMANRSVTKCTRGPSTSVYKHDRWTYLFYFVCFSLLETVTLACYFILFVAANLLELVLLLRSCRIAQ